MTLGILPLSLHVISLIDIEGGTGDVTLRIARTTFIWRWGISTLLWVFGRQHIVLDGITESLAEMFCTTERLGMELGRIRGLVGPVAYPCSYFC